LAFAVVAFGPRGTDVAAQLYRVGLFHRQGLVVWDSQWYGGHWTMSYSVLFPIAAGILGIATVAALSAAGASWAFDRLALGHFGPSARVGSAVFAVGTVAAVAIGQLPFLFGEALAIGAVWAAARRRRYLAAALAALVALASPLAAAFLVLVVLAWLVGSWPQRHWPLVALIACPSAVVGVLFLAFPGQGSMPFRGWSFVWFAAALLAVAIVMPRQERAIRAGALLYLAAGGLSYVLSTPMGGNATRLVTCVGAPLIACTLHPNRRRLVALAAGPILVAQWSPAVAAYATGSDASSRAAYYAPLLTFLSQHREPIARVEIVPTRSHWEAAFVAPTVALARGWERQLDTAIASIFYQNGALNQVSYRAWLSDAGVRYVALPDVALDYAGVLEGQLLHAGVSGLRPVWSDAHWKVFELSGSTGMVAGPGRLTDVNGRHIEVTAATASPLVVKVRYDPRWTVARGSACIAEASGGWIGLDVRRPGPVRVELRLFPAAAPKCSAEP
jgi:hypothetical protein